MSKSSRIAIIAVSVVCTGLIAQAQDKPNIVIIWGDDIGWFDPSANHQPGSFSLGDAMQKIQNSGPNN
jgi:hypothetical protein